MKTSDIKGIIPPVITPMNNDPEQTVNHQALREQVERLLAGGVHGIFPMGTNGEAYALSFQEKEEILATVIDQVKGRVPVYAGTGCITTAETIRLTRELDKEVAILAGNDGAILTCLKEGGAGGIAGRANIWPETVAKIYDCFKAGDLEGAQAAQDAIAILQQTFKYGNPNTIIKTAVALQGHPVGKCRAPFNYVPEEGMEAIKKVLAENEAKGLH